MKINAQTTINPFQNRYTKNNKNILILLPKMDAISIQNPLKIRSGSVL